MSFLNTPVASLIARPPVGLAPTASAAEAARRMTAEGVSCLLVEGPAGLAGIVTDRDLRSRVLARGASPETPVGEIMTPSPITLDADAPAFEALLTMTRHGIHHLPILGRGRVVGVVTTTDLLRRESANPIYLAAEIREQQSAAGLAALCRRLPEVLYELVDADASASHIGHVLTALGDAVGRRLLELAEAELGPPPVPYAWLVFGSQARQEQSLHTDQDNGLLLADTAAPEHEGYFERLARQVCDGLDACGYVYCPGEVMARNPRWRQRLGAWEADFSRWTRQPESKALMHASIFFDLRRLAGDAALFESLRSRVVELAQQNQIFLAHMARNALDYRPPLGLFGRFLWSDTKKTGAPPRTLDLKHRGLVPIIDLARLAALSGGLPAVETRQRLEAAAQAGALSRDGAAELLDAFEVIAFLRLRHQVRRLRRGEAADNHLPPAELSPFERRTLRSAFRVVQQQQASLEYRFQLGNLG